MECEFGEREARGCVSAHEWRCETHVCTWDCQVEHVIGNMFRCLSTGHVHICDCNCRNRWTTARTRRSASCRGACKSPPPRSLSFSILTRSPSFSLLHKVREAEGLSRAQQEEGRGRGGGGGIPRRRDPTVCAAQDPPQPQVRVRVLLRSRGGRTDACNTTTHDPNCGAPAPVPRRHLLIY